MCVDALLMDEQATNAQRKAHKTKTGAQHADIDTAAANNVDVLCRINSRPIRPHTYVWRMGGVSMFVICLFGAFPNTSHS